MFCIVLQINGPGVVRAPNGTSSLLRWFSGFAVVENVNCLLCLLNGVTPNGRGESKCYWSLSRGDGVLQHETSSLSVQVAPIAKGGTHSHVSQQQSDQLHGLFSNQKEDRVSYIITNRVKRVKSCLQMKHRTIEFEGDSDDNNCEESIISSSYSGPIQFGKKEG